MTQPTNTPAPPEWPKPIVRDGPYRVYKGHKYTVYDDGNSAETPYQTDLATAALSRLRIAVAKLQFIETLQITNRDETTGYEYPGSWQQLSTWKSELAKEALAEIGPLPGDGEI